MKKVFGSIVAFFMCICVVTTSVTATQITGSSNQTYKSEQRTEDDGADSFFVSENASRDTALVTDEELSRDQLPDVKVVAQQMEFDEEVVEIEDMFSVDALDAETKDQAMYRYMADAYLNYEGWFNDEAQQYPEGFYETGALKDKFWWEPISRLWIGTEAASGSIELDRAMKAVYQAAVIDTVYEYAQLSEEMQSDLTSDGTYDFEIEEKKWDIAEVAAESKEVAVVIQAMMDAAASGEKSGEFVANAVKNLMESDSSLDAEEAETAILATFQEQFIDTDKNLDKMSGKLELVKLLLNYAESYADAIEKCVQLSRIAKTNEDLKYILKDMQSNLDFAFGPDYQGTLDEKIREKQIMNDALQEMIDIVGTNDILQIYRDEFMAAGIKTTIEVMYGIFCERIWDALGKSNPDVKGAKIGLDIGVPCVQAVFQSGIKVDNAAKHNVKCKLHRVISGGMKKQKDAYSRNKTDETARDYVNYMHLFVADYCILLDNVEEWAGTPYVETFFGGFGTVYQSWYNAEKKKCLWSNSPVPSYDEYTKRIKKDWQILKASAKGVVFSQYQKAMADYAEQMSVQQTEKAVIVENSPHAEETGLLEEIANYPTVPTITIKAPEEIEKMEEEVESALFTFRAQDITSNLTLTQDRTTYGNMKLSKGDVLDLNGQTLVVNGDFEHEAGQIRFNGGTLCIMGNYYNRRQDDEDNDGNTTYTYSFGTLRMVDDKDLMQVAGDFYWRSACSAGLGGYNPSNWTDDITYTGTSYNMLRAGTIQIGGDFTAIHAWKPSTLEGHTHKEVFVNPNEVNISFSNYTGSKFNQVEFPEKAEGKDYYPITWSGYMEGFVLTQDMYLILPEVEYPEGYHKLEINGALDLNGYNLTLPNDIIHTNGQIRFNGGKLDVQGDYHVKRYGTQDNDGNPTYTYGKGTLRMTEADDMLQVAGDFYWFSGRDSFYGSAHYAQPFWTTDITDTSTSSNILRAGTIRIGGDFTAMTSWRPSTTEGDTHKEEFVNPNGTEIYFNEDGSEFNKVEFPEKAEGKTYYPITWSGTMKGFSLQQDMYLILPETTEEEGFHILNIDGALDLNGHTLTLPNNIVHVDGQIKFSGGKLDVQGDYHVKRYGTQDNDGNLTYTYSFGTLRMVDDKDLMQVAGDFYWRSACSAGLGGYNPSNWIDDITYTGTSYNMLRAGTIQIGGDFTAIHAWKPSTLEGHSHKEVFVNPNEVDISFSNYTGSKFNQVEFPERAEGKDYYPITWSGYMEGFALTQDMYLILPEVEYPEGYHKLEINGALDLNGHKLTLPDDIMHTSGQIRFNGGTLDVQGDYHAKNFNKLDDNAKPTYKNGSGTLRMDGAKDKMQVAGDFYWNANKDWTTNITYTGTDKNLLRAGTIRVGGDFKADSKWTPSILDGDTHAVYLKGADCKEIKLPSGSKFNVLKIDRELDDYDISPDSCWQALWINGKYYMEPQKSLTIGETIILRQEDGKVSIMKEGEEPVNIMVTLIPQQEQVVVSEDGEVMLMEGTTITSNTNGTVVILRSEGTVSTNSVVTGQNIMVGEVYVSATEEGTKVIVDENGNVAIPTGGTVTQKNIMIGLLQGGAMDTNGNITGSEMVVGGVTVTAPEDEKLSANTEGTITVPSNSIVTKSDGTQSKLPEGGAITSSGEIKGIQVVIYGGTTDTPPASGENTDTPPASGETTDTPPASGGTIDTPPASGGTTDTPPASGKNEVDDTVEVSKIAISGISQKIAAGKKITLSVSIIPDDATNKAVTWSTSNKKYATVSSKGVVKVKKDGIGKTVTITAEAKDGSNKKATYKIKIMKHAVKSIKLKASQKTVKAGSKVTVKATVKTTGKSANKTLKWTSSNTKYATVSNKGVVKTKKAGKGKKVTITATSTDGTNKKATIKISIK